MITVISLHSREGGAGKTSIGLSAAVQLAAAGHKVALVELDSIGPHLGQCLPLSRITLEAGGHLAFRCESLRSVPNLFWWLTGWWEAPRRNVLEAGDKLVLPPSCVVTRDPNQLNTMILNLTVFPASCFVRDLDHVNQMVMRRDTQQRFIWFIRDLVTALERDGHEFVFIDNSSGLSLMGAMMLSWMRRMRKTKHRIRMEPWFVSAESSLHGLTIFEMNVFEGLPTPQLIVNRSREEGWHSCPRGQHRVVGELVGTEDFFSLPLWLGTERRVEDLARDFLPSDMHVAVLQEDTSVARAGELPTEPAAVDPAISWGQRVEEFFVRFIVPAASTTQSANSSSFHRDVATALVHPLG